MKTLFEKMIPQMMITDTLEKPTVDTIKQGLLELFGFNNNQVRISTYLDMACTDQSLFKTVAILCILRHLTMPDTDRINSWLNSKELPPIAIPTGSISPQKMHAWIFLDIIRDIDIAHNASDIYQADANGVFDISL